MQALPVTYDPALAARGAVLFQEFGCQACHSVNGAPGVGPTMQNVYNHPVRLTDGSVILADEAFIRESILNPNAKVVNGFTANIMLTAVQARLPEISQPENLNALVEYINPRRRGAGRPPAARPGDARGRLARRPGRGRGLVRGPAQRSMVSVSSIPSSSVRSGEGVRGQPVQGLHRSRQVGAYCCAQASSASRASSSVLGSELVSTGQKRET